MRFGAAGPPFDPAAQRAALREAIAAFYAARQAGDAESFASYFATDARLFVLGNPVLNPGSGMRLGRTDIANYLRLIHGTNEYLDFTIVNVVAEGDAIAVWWRARIKTRSNGREGSFDNLDQMRVRNGQIIELAQFFDTGAFAIMKGRIPQP
ncbi:MAG: nuclear transport factor 2 family protein [Rhizobiales bacterium]|nr:nuclear transport factor 2 family protein [Hyphomicrobiales bacterium]